MKCKKIIIFIELFTLILILLLNLFTFRSGDDYDFITNVSNRGIIQNCITGYYEWDGRFLSITSIIQGLMLVYLPIEAVTFIWNICFFINGYFIFLLINKEVNLNLNSIKTRIITICIIIIVSWLGAIRHFAETIYWGTGGVYTLALLLGTSYIIIFLNFQKNKKNLFSIIIFIFSSFIIGSLTQNLTIPIIVLILFTISMDIIEKQKKYHLQNFAFLIFLLLGLLFITLAPGSTIRFSVSNSETSSLLNLILNYCIVLGKYLFRSVFLIIFTIIAAVAVAILQKPNLKIKMSNIFKFEKLNLLQILKQFKWLIVALSSIVPFAMIPDLACQRTTIYFINFFCIFLFISILTIIDKITIASDYKSINKNITISKKLFAILFIFTISLVSYNLIKGAELKRQITQRENILQKSRNKTVYLRIIKPEQISICYNFSDYPISQTDSFDFVRKFQEKYYQVQIIAVK